MPLNALQKLLAVEAGIVLRAAVDLKQVAQAVLVGNQGEKTVRSKKEIVGLGEILSHAQKHVGEVQIPLVEAFVDGFQQAFREQVN